MSRISKPLVVLMGTLLLCTTLVEAQSTSPKIDSLNRALLQQKADTMIILLQNYLGAAYMDLGNFDEARNYFTKSLNVAVRIKNRRKESNAYRNIGNCWYYQGTIPKALETWQKSLAIAEQIQYTEAYSPIKMNIANAYTAEGNYTEALHIYFDALKWMEANKDTQNTMICLTNIADVYSYQKKYPESLKFFDLALGYKDIMNPEQYATILINVALVQLEMEDNTKAEKSYLELLDITIKNQLTYYEGFAHGGLGNIALNRRQREKARSEFLLAKETSAKSGNIQEVGIVNERLATLYWNAVEEGDDSFLKKYFNGNKSLALSTARHLVDSSIQIFKEGNVKEQLMRAYNGLCNIEKSMGLYKEAFEHHVLLKELSDTLLNQERDKKLTESAMQYDFDKKEATTKAVQERKDIRQRNIRYSISAGLLGALLFLGVVYRQRNKIKKEKQRSEELLLNILPEEVAEELKTKGEAEAKQIDEVTVLFTDFKGFTQLSEKLTAKELVSEINHCFTAFDHIMHKYGVEKIKTIGDAYMAAGGLPIPNKTHAADVVKAALEIQQFMHELKMKKEAEGKLLFELRIGIHTGPVVAGIVGVKKFAYDIWGDTVNTASRMESSGEAGKINISETTYTFIKDQFNCTHRGKISAKGKGEVDMYFVQPN